MAELTSRQIRQRFIKFFQNRGHVLLPGASLIPQNDPSVLFNTAGMQPLVPYLLGKPHPQGKRLVSAQKCVRTVDIEEIGDNTHLTFFEMLGNWSLGDYSKKEAIEWSYELLTSEKEGFGLDPNRLYVTCFEGNDNAPKDTEAAEIWTETFKKNDIDGERIFFRPKESNWWDLGDNGPSGPDSEMFYDITGDLDRGLTLEEFTYAEHEQKIVEIWNDVFMEYLKKDGSVVGKLESKNIDTGSGFERLVMVVQGKKNVFGTDLFYPLMRHINENPSLPNTRSERIIADHIRTSIFLIADGVVPSNTDRGYILRRLIRRAIRYADLLNLPPRFIETFVQMVSEIYEGVYDDIGAKKAEIASVLYNEEEKFRKTLATGLKKFRAMSSSGSISGKDAFILFSSYGFPFELTKEIAKEGAIDFDEDGFQKELVIHQNLSRKGAEQKFKGGLSGTSEMETKYHTATHLLHQALRDVLGNAVEQRGSNITPERLRFDFAYDKKLTDEEKKKVEDIVNEKIQANLPMNKVTMSKKEAEDIGALHFFGDKYGDQVDVYYIGNSLEEAYSKEFCGGPHVSNTGELAKGTDSEGKPRTDLKFKIIKEESTSAVTRRIRAVLE